MRANSCPCKGEALVSGEDRGYFGQSCKREVVRAHQVILRSLMPRSLVPWPKMNVNRLRRRLVAQEVRRRRTAHCRRESPGAAGCEAWRGVKYTRACSTGRTLNGISPRMELRSVATRGSLTAVDVGNRFHRWWRSELLRQSVGAALCRRHLECRSFRCRTTDLLALIDCSLCGNLVPTLLLE
jgi:hypothetical protein